MIIHSQNEDHYKKNYDIVSIISEIREKIKDRMRKYYKWMKKLGILRLWPGSDNLCSISILIVSDSLKSMSRLNWSELVVYLEAILLLIAIIEMETNI